MENQDRENKEQGKSVERIENQRPQIQSRQQREPLISKQRMEQAMQGQKKQGVVQRKQGIVSRKQVVRNVEQIPQEQQQEQEKQQERQQEQLYNEYAETAQGINTQTYETNEAYETREQTGRQALVDVEQINSAYIESFNDEEVVEDRLVTALNAEDDKKRKKIKTPEQKKKQKIILISISGVIVVSLVGLIIFNKLHSDKGVDFTYVDMPSIESTSTADEQGADSGEETSSLQGEQEESNEKSVVDNTTNVDTSNNGTSNAETAESNNTEYDYVTDKHMANIGEVIEVPTVVNIKLADDTQYRDYDTYYNIGLAEVIQDKDKVEEIINTYNEKGAKRIDIEDDMEDKDTQLVIFRVQLGYPSDYPATDNNAYVIPDVALELKGTYEDELGEKDYSSSIVIGDNAYNIAPAVSVYDIPTKIDISEKFNFDFLVKIPKGVTGNAYNAVVTIGNETITYKGKGIE